MINKRKVIVGLSDPKGPSNVGAVLRAAGCFQTDMVCYTGERYDRATRYRTDTHNAREEVPLEHVDSLYDVCGPEIKLVCVELAEGAISLTEFQHPDQAMYVFGPEDGTVSQQLIDQADGVVFVPTKGCLNLAATVNVVLYDRLLKSGVEYDADALIQRVRDRNNTVKVRR